MPQVMTLRCRKILVKLSIVRQLARSSRRRTFMLDPTMVCADLTAVLKVYHHCVMELTMTYAVLCRDFHRFVWYFTVVSLSLCLISCYLLCVVTLLDISVLQLFEGENVPIVLVYLILRVVPRARHTQSSGFQSRSNFRNVLYACTFHVTSMSVAAW